MMKTKLVIAGMLFVVVMSLEAQNLKNMWTYHTKKERCIQTIEKLDKEDKESVFQTLQKSCFTSEFTKMFNRDFYAYTCNGRPALMVSNSEKDCKDFIDYLTIANQMNWYFYSSEQACLNVRKDNEWKDLHPGKFLMKEGCEIKLYKKDAGLLILDCKKNKAISEQMPVIVFHEWEYECNNLQKVINE